MLENYVDICVKEFEKTKKLNNFKIKIIFGPPLANNESLSFSI